MCSALGKLCSAMLSCAWPGYEVFGRISCAFQGKVVLGKAKFSLLCCALPGNVVGDQNRLY